MDFPEMDVTVTLTGREWYCVMKSFCDPNVEASVKDHALSAMVKVAAQVTQASNRAVRGAPMSEWQNEDRREREGC
jgi:hypothetical protein